MVKFSWVPSLSMGEFCGLKQGVDVVSYIDYYDQSFCNTLLFFWITISCVHRIELRPWLDFC